MFFFLYSYNFTLNYKIITLFLKNQFFSFVMDFEGFIVFFENTNIKILNLFINLLEFKNTGFYHKYHLPFDLFPATGSSTR